MQKVSLVEFRTTAVLLGPSSVVALLIAAATYNPQPHTLPLTSALWWRVCMVVFSALTLIGVAAFVLPHLDGLSLPRRKDIVKERDDAHLELAALRPKVQRVDSTGLVINDFALLPQGATPKRRVIAFAKTIREVLIRYYERLDADAEVDQAIKLAIIKDIDPLLGLVEQDVGRGEMVTLIRMNGIYDTVRGLARIADQLDILAGKMKSE